MSVGSLPTQTHESEPLLPAYTHEGLRRLHRRWRNVCPAHRLSPRGCGAVRVAVIAATVPAAKCAESFSLYNLHDCKSFTVVPVPGAVSVRNR